MNFNDYVFRQQKNWQIGILKENKCIAAAVRWTVALT